MRKLLKKIQIAGKIVFLLLFLFFCTLVSSAQIIDLSKSIIVVNSDNSRNLEAAQFLQQEMFLRSGIKLEISDSFTEKDIPVIFLGQSTNFPLPSALFVPSKEESFAIWIDTIKRKAPTTLIIGRDESGVLFGVGKFIQNLYLPENYISIDKTFSLALAPADKIRAQQIITNTQCEDGFVDWENKEEVEQFVREMVIFGTNGFEPTEPALIDDYLEKLGVNLFIKLKCQDIIDYDKKSDLELLEVYKDIEGIDHITSYGGDASGAVKPQLFFPHMERVLPLLLQGQPGAKWWYSNQCLDDHAKDEDDYIFNYINENRPPWLYGMVYGPWTKRGIKEIRKDLPSQYELRHFPEICHPRWCQYPIPEWDRIYSVVWPRNNSIYMMPTMMTDIFKATRDHTIGSLPYNHTGSYNDLNKFAWASIAWNPEAEVEDILKSYAKTFFAYDFIKAPIQQNNGQDFTKKEVIDMATEFVAKGLSLLEQNWQGPLKENTSTESALEYWKTIADCIGGADNNWRVEMYLYKARIDAQIKRKYDLEMQLENQVLKILENAKPSNYKKAIKDAYKTLARIDNEFQSEKEFRNELIDMGLSENFGDLDEIIKNLYTSFNNRYWLEKQMELSSRPEDLLAIVQYEDPGEGGFYDNLGVRDAQPHLLRSPEWKDDPGFVYSNINWVDNKANSDLRHSQLTSVVARYDTPLEMKWENLDRSAAYKIKIVYNGPFGIRIKCQTDDGSLIHDFMEQSGDDIMDFSIPVASTSDGELKLKWTQDTADIKRGVSVSEIWLIKND
ncbi:MAG: hypothetical protein K9H49_04335 [Bacteroidales bacterium]|nr:hypothetical protein [Bacteroidales bacterium]MCF8389043.1 hypothetical protein [Bacteroidales bacterium]